MGYSPWGHEASDMTERAHTHTHSTVKEICLIVLKVAMKFSTAEYFKE